VPHDALIGMDLGGTTVSAGIVRPSGEVLARLHGPTHGRGPGTALETILDLLDRLWEHARAGGIGLGGVGIGVPGTVDAERGAIGEEIHYVPELARTPIAPLVAARLGLPVFVDNDVNTLALGEWMFGAGQGARSLVLLAVGTGVGGGIILDGHLVRGHGGYGGELGHVPIKFDGRPCICGGRGCLKAYVAGTDIGEEGSRRLGRPVGAEEVFRLAAAREPAMRALVADVAEALGAGLAVVVNGLNPERVLVAGGVAESLRAVEAEIRASLARHAFPGALRRTQIEILALDKAATVRGGAALVRYETQRRRGDAG
jgi:glucokinase